MINHELLSVKQILSDNGYRNKTQANQRGYDASRHYQSYNKYRGGSYRNSLFINGLQKNI